MDEALARRTSTAWLGAEATLTPIDAMNSSTWLVDVQGERHVLKISRPADAPGLAAAAWLEARAFPTGAPVRMAVEDGRLVALLRYVEGRPLEPSDAAVVGESLGRVHQLLVRAPVPAGMDRWPWPWLDTGTIVALDLRAAAVAAIARAMALAPSLTHAVLHGDPAPEAFVDTGDGIALIDWGAAVHGPLLYDVASAAMYVSGDPAFLRAYEAAGPLAPDELAHVGDLLAVRWAIQAWYFSDRLARDDLTGLESRADNEKGLADARRALLG